MSAVLEAGGSPKSRTSGSRDGFFTYHGVWAPGVRLFRQLNFAYKALIVSLALLVPLLALAAWQLRELANEAMSSRKDATRQHVEVAVGVLTWAHGLEKSGQVSREQAQALAKATINTMRYDRTEYFWINDMDHRMVLHPIKSELNGKDVSSMKDPNGFMLFKAFVETVRTQGKGFVSYQWPRPGAQQPVDKLSYVQGFEPWGWVIGSGIYVDDLYAVQRRQLQLSLAVALTSIAIAGYLFLSFYRVMNGGLKETSRHLRAITNGDLTTSPHPWGRDEAAALMLDMRRMQESLREMVQNVRRSSDDIVHSSSEIASGAMDLSARTEQASANLEESAASMEEITATVASTTVHTAEASRMASHNASIATEGGQAMREVVQTMEGIRESSAKIGEIISTIDGIAFQTNILALNAAVEAARAGEQGRGFAVVASEVRSLAQRSADAAKQIKSLISHSVEQVEGGVGVVRRAGDQIDEVVAASGRVSELLNQVATGAHEQSAGITQIGQAVQELDRMTQQNAALVEETAAASSAMKDQASMLAQQVARFKLPVGLGLHTQAPIRELTADFDFDAAIEAHRHWKVKLRQAIADSQHLDADVICQDNQCPLGRWIHGPGGSRWKDRPSFVELTARHADFHEAAGNVARTINAGHHQEAERLIGTGSRFAQLSTEVATLLTRAKRGL